MKRTTLAATAFALALGATSSAYAVPLTELLNGGSITVEDKLFDSFEIVFQSSSSGNDVDTDNIDVTELLSDMDSGPGLLFDFLNGEFVVEGDDIFAFIDFQFAFRVSVLDPTMRIVGVQSTLGGGIANVLDGDNDVGFGLVETVGDSPLDNNLAEFEADFSVLNDVITNTASVAEAIPARSEIWVSKNILVHAVDSTDRARLEFIEQRFDQRQVDVPVPSMLGLGTIGLMGLVALRRRKIVS